MKAVGIDLGTTNSVVAAVIDGKPTSIQVEGTSSMLPSAVRYIPGGVPVVGAAARAAFVEDPVNTMISTKKLLGRGLSEVGERHGMPYRIRDSDGILEIETDAGPVKPIEVSSEILKRLKRAADTFLEDDIRKAVITVPAYFDDAQRQATRQAARLAQLDVLRLINEPTAAALAYGLEQREEGAFAVFDLGGGTFDISILDLVEGVFEVKATCGDTQLGGDDLDRVLADFLLENIGQTFSAADPHTQASALRSGEQLKWALSERPQVDFSFEIGGVECKGTLTKQKYKELAKPILERLRAPCRQALQDAELRIHELDGVVLVGGSTKAPLIRDFVSEFFKTRPICDLDPDHVVALGAASQADLLSAESELKIVDGGDVLLLDVTPLSLGLEMMGGLVEKVLPRCSSVPASRAQDFTTYKDGQTAMDIHVVQGERELVQDCRSLGRFQLHGIPPGPAGQARIRVLFQLDVNGLLTVSATELTSGTDAEIRVSPSYGLDDAQVESMLQASLDFAESDVSARLLRTAVVEAERVIYAVETALAKDGDLLDADEKGTIQKSVDDVKALLSSDNHHRISDASAALEEQTAQFAHKRMDRALNAGFRDMSVDALDQVVGQGSSTKRSGENEA